MEFAVFAAWIDAGWQRVKERGVETPPGERGWQFLEVDCGKMGFDTCIDHVMCKLGSGPAPQRKNRRDASPGKLALAIGSHVLQKQITEDRCASRPMFLRRQWRPTFFAHKSHSGTETECARRLQASQRHRACARNNSSRTPCMLTRPNVSVTVVKAPTTSIVARAARFEQRPGTVLATRPSDEGLWARQHQLPSPSRCLRELAPEMRHTTALTMRNRRRLRSDMVSKCLLGSRQDA